MREIFKLNLVIVLILIPKSKALYYQQRTYSLRFAISLCDNSSLSCIDFTDSCKK